MKIAAGKKYLTRDGRVALIGAVNEDAVAAHKIIGWLDGTAYTWCISGDVNPSDVPNGRDLVAEHREPREWWLVPNGGGYAVYPVEQLTFRDGALKEPKPIEGQVHVREVLP